MQHLVDDIERLARQLPPITLKEMSSIRLMNRTDQKYLTNVDTLKQLLLLTVGSYYSQEIADHRVSPYCYDVLGRPCDALPFPAA